MTCGYMKYVMTMICFAATLIINAETKMIKIGIENRLPEPWRADLSYAHKRKTVSITHTSRPYTPTLKSRGAYDVMGREMVKNVQCGAITIGAGNSEMPYRRDETTQMGYNQVRFNNPIKINDLQITESKNIPFNNINTEMMTRVGRGDTPSDPSIKGKPGPIGNGYATIVICGIIYYWCKREREKKKLKIKRD